MIELPTDFIHTAPKGYKYECEQFRSKLVRIWLRHPDGFVYTTGAVRSVWGFYNTRERKYYAPINAKKPGKVIDIDKTTPYTAMQILKPMRPTVLSFV